MIDWDKSLIGPTSPSPSPSPSPTPTPTPTPTPSPSPTPSPTSQTHSASESTTAKKSHSKSDSNAMSPPPSSSKAAFLAKSTVTTWLRIGPLECTYSARYSDPRRQAPKREQFFCTLPTVFRHALTPSCGGTLPPAAHPTNSRWITGRYRRR